MDQAQRGITFRHRINNDADSINIINLLKVLVLHIHLAVNTVDALDTVADGCSVDAVLFQVFLMVAQISLRNSSPCLFSRERIML